MSNTQPLAFWQPIVKPEDGTPTPFFMQWWQEQIKANGSFAEIGDAAEMSGYLDLLDASPTWGDLLYRGETLWENLGAGTSGEVLQTQGAGAAPVWVSVGDTLDEISGTWGEVLYRGEFEWQSLGVGTAGNVLTTNGAGASPSWEPGSSVTEIDDLSDVDTSSTAPTDTQVLTWSAADSEWQPADASGGNDGPPEYEAATGDVGLPFTTSWSSSAYASKGNALTCNTDMVLEDITFSLGSAGAQYKVVVGRMESALSTAEIVEIVYDGSSQSSVLGENTFDLSDNPPRLRAGETYVFLLTITSAGNSGVNRTNFPGSSGTFSNSDLTWINSSRYAEDNPVVGDVPFYSVSARVPFDLNYWTGDGARSLETIMAEEETPLDALFDVDLTGAADGEFLKYEVVSGVGTWVPGTGAGGATSIDDLSDVDTSTVAPTDEQVLTWSAADSEWQPADASGGGGGGSSVWDEVTLVQVLTQTSSTQFSSWSLNFTNDPSTNDDVFIIAIIGQTDDAPVSMTFDGQAADQIHTKHLGTFDSLIVGVFTGMSGTGSRTAAVTGSLGTEYRGSLLAYQLRGVDADTIQFDSSTVINAAGSLSITPVRDGGFAFGVNNISDASEATTGGTIEEVEDMAATNVEATFWTVGHRTSTALVADTPATYTFEEASGGDDRTFGVMIVAEPKSIIPMNGISDVDAYDPADGDVLAYDSTLARWVAGEPVGGGGGGANIGSEFRGFHYEADGSTTQAIPGSTLTGITNFNTQVTDTESAFNTTTGEFTVPASLDGQYMFFYGNFRWTSSGSGAIYLQRDTGGGFTTIAQETDAGTDTYQTGSPPVLLATGDKYRIACFSSSAKTVRNVAANNWFGGFVIESAALTQSFVLAASDETTALTTGTGKVTFRMPYAFTVSEVRASLTTAGTGANLVTVDINENGVSILSTPITIDATEKTSTTATTPPVISDANLADDAEITIDIDQIDSGGVSAGLKVTLIGAKA